MSVIALIFGFFAAAAALLAQVFFSLFVTAATTGTLSPMILIGAATIEEGLKLIFLLQFARRSQSQTTFSHALLFGIGFAAAELSLILLSTPTLVFPRLGGVLVIHLLTTLIIYGGLRLKENHRLSPYIALAGAILIHVLYNSAL